VVGVEKVGQGEINNNKSSFLSIVTTHFELYESRIEERVCDLVSSNIIMPSFFGNSTM
jgi:hypothetical protein